MIQKGDPVSKNWTQINRNTAEIDKLRMEVSRLRTVVAQLEKIVCAKTPDSWPFRVHTTPNVLRPDDAQDADAWRKFTVQHGYVNGIQTDGCEDTDGEGTTPTEVVIPSGTAEYYIWVEIQLTSGAVFTAAIDHGATGWGSFPTQPDLPDIFYVPLARIDTATYATEKRAIIRQFVYEDIFLNLEGGGGDPRWA